MDMNPASIEFSLVLYGRRMVVLTRYSSGSPLIKSFKYICVYIHICTYICVCISTVYIHTYMCVYTHTQVCVCMYTYINSHAYV